MPSTVFEEKFVINHFFCHRCKKEPEHVEPEEMRTGAECPNSHYHGGSVL
jgi:hypothetical protein